MDLQDYRALRDGAGVVVRSDRGLIAVAGADRRTWLHGLVTNDVAALTPGTGCYAAWLTAQGRFITDMTVNELGDLLLVDLHVSVKDTVLEKLAAFVFAEDVQLGDVTGSFASVGVHGREAASVLGMVFGGARAAGLAAFAPHQNARLPFEGEAAIVVRDDELGVIGFTVYVDATRVDQLTRALAEAGARRVSADVADIVRLESGKPAFGSDMDEDIIPLEAGIESRAISFTKGCYPGQEVIIRVLHRGGGRVVKKLVGLTLEGSQVPCAATTLMAGEKEVGRVTSAAMSPAVGHPIALGYVHRDFMEPGTKVQAVLGDHRTTATVTALPFVE